MSLLYKKQEDLTYSVECKLLDNGKVHFSFSADCGKFGTDEQLDNFEYNVKELLHIFQMDKQLQKQLITEIMNEDAKDKQQTAVGWIENNIQSDMSWIEIIGLIRQAKQMEREQIEKAWLDGLTKDELQKIAANKYYTQTYGE